MMVHWQELLKLLLQGTAATFFDVTFWFIVLIVGYQYWQLRKSQIKLFGVAESSLPHQVGWSLLYGTAGGLFGSLLATIVGLSINDSGLNYVWPVALGLMFFNMRFLCFAYAGGIVALSSLVFGWPTVNVPQLLGLVAILHFTESMLIAISGRYSAAPLIIKTKSGQLAGAFSLQNFWPLPLVLMAATAIPSGEIASGIGMPDWWPLFPAGADLPAGSEWLYVLLPVVGVLGYTDIAVQSLPAERRKFSAIHLAIYSALLLGLSFMGTKYLFFQFAAALVSPLGHELLIQYDNHQEVEGAPRLVPSAYGLMVLDSVSHSPARTIGIRPGDIMLQFDKIEVNSRYELVEALRFIPESFMVMIERAGQRLSLPAKFENGERRFGVILVPDGSEPFYMSLSSQRFGLWDWLWEKYQKLIR